MGEARTLTIERIFDTPVEKVWAAWTEPEQLAKWWGPKQFTSRDNQVDLRVGGAYRLHMVVPPEMAEQMGSADMYSGGAYKEIVPLKKLVLTDNFMDKDGNVAPEAYGVRADFPELLITLEFEELPEGKTKMTLTHEGFPAGEMADESETGWNESFDKLAESLQ